MSLETITALKCFNENARSTDPGIHPDAFNLYTGLANLAAAIEAIESRLDSSSHAVAVLGSSADSKKRSRLLTSSPITERDPMQEIYMCRSSDGSAVGRITPHGESFVLLNGSTVKGYPSGMKRLIRDRFVVSEGNRFRFIRDFPCSPSNAGYLVTGRPGVGRKGWKSESTGKPLG